MKSAGYVVLTFTFHREGRRWVGHCRELGTSTFGRSLPEVDKKLEEAVLLHLNTLEDVGERERFFREHNITVFSRKPKIKETFISAPLDKKTFVHPHLQSIPA